MKPLEATAIPVDTSDEQLVARAQQGSSEAFAVLFRRYRPAIARYAGRMLGDDARAEDVVQEVFLSVLNHLGRFRGESKLGTWLTVITINKCRTQRTRWFARWRMLRRRLKEAPSEPAPAADEGVRRDETSARVRQAVQKLRPRDREVIVLHYLEQHEPAEMARLLGVSQNAVEVRLHRARQRLKELLKDVVEA